MVVAAIDKRMMNEENDFFLPAISRLVMRIDKFKRLGSTPVKIQLIAHSLLTKELLLDWISAPESDYKLINLQE
jgi:5-bromo-4-chloroindolyl phosphate hydrolysis protein